MFPIDKNGPQSPLHPLKSLDELIAQEETFRFDAFGAADAVALAKCMMDNEKDWGRPVAFCIYLNGYTVFQYVPEGTGKLNELWFKKKIDTVMAMRMSTMRFWAWQESIGAPPRAAEMLPTATLVSCGGGFPITVKGCGVVGVIVVSGLSDQADHDFIIDSLQKFRDWA